MGKSSDRALVGNWFAMSLWYENKHIDRLPGHWTSKVRSTSASRYCSLAYRFFRGEASWAPNSPARDLFRAEYFRRNSARDPRRQSTTDAQSARAGEIRHSGRERFARSRRPRKMERNQTLQHFFLAHCCLTSGSDDVANRQRSALVSRV
jgi:hypothetical protein